MRFRVERDALHDAAAMVARVAGKMPPCDGTLLVVEGDKLSLTATDLDVSISTVVPVADALPGRVSVPAKRLAAASGSLRPGAVDVVANEGEGTAVELTSGVSSASTGRLRAEDFPRIVDIPPSEPIDGAAFRSALARVVPCASLDANRPLLTGVLFDSLDGNLRLTASDSYRMATITTDLAWRGGPVLVPALALRELGRMPKGDVLTLGINGNHISFGCGETTMTSRLIEGVYPNFLSMVKPSMPFNLTVPTAGFVESLHRVCLGLDSPTEPVRLDLSPMLVRLTVLSDDGSPFVDEQACEWDGTELTIYVRPAYLKDAIEAADVDELRIGIEAKLKPIQIRSGSWAGLIVPVNR